MVGSKKPPKPPKPPKSHSTLTKAIQSSIGVALAASPLSTLSIDSPSSAFGADKHNAMVSNLNNAISIVNVASDLSQIVNSTPLAIVRGALTLTCTLLTRYRDTLSNQNELSAVAKYCAKICFALHRATVGKKEGDLSPQTVRAIQELNSAVRAIQSSITASRNRPTASKAFNAQLDMGLITGWNQELDQILKVFNTEMHLATSAVVNETNSDIKEIKALLAASVSRNEPVLQGKRPPSPPLILFGRDELVKDVIGSIRSSIHVALIGPGGIGKSSIAVEVLNHLAMIEAFQDRRFVQCDIWKMLLGSLLDFLGSKRTLLVLDNAETILDAPGDSTKIRDAIIAFASLPSVSLILTTRTTVLPQTIPWKRLQVPVLDKASAQETFFAIYSTEEGQSSSVVDDLLADLEFHPLSIHLLAQVGAQNMWSVPELEEEWKSQQTQLLHLGRPGDQADKLDSLAVTIELSLNSPTFKAISSGRNILETIAFLPRGVHKPKLKDLFPQIQNIKSVVTQFATLSLTSNTTDNFITMLAPIRSHIRTSSPSALPLLKDVQAYYYKQLIKYGPLDPGQEGFDDGTWIILEDINVERLIAHYLLIPEELREADRHCLFFLALLSWHKPRTSTLLPLVRSLPDTDEAKWKPSCMQAFAKIAWIMGNVTEAQDLYAEARELHLARKDMRSAAECLHDLAAIDQSLVDIPAAKEKFEIAIKEFTNLGEDALAARSIHSLSRVFLGSGDPQKGRELMAKALETFELVKDKRAVADVARSLGLTEFYCENFAQAKVYHESSRDAFLGLEDHESYANCLVSLANTEGRLGNRSIAGELLKDARACFLKLNQGLRAATCLKDIADSLRLQGNSVAAGEVLAEAQAEFRSLGARRSEVDCIQTMGEIEFALGNNEKAAALCQEAKNGAKDMGYSYGEAQSTFTLGEIAQAQKEYEIAKKWFEGAKALFEQLELQGNVWMCTSRLGLIAFDTGDPQEGDRLVGEAKDLTLQAGMISQAAHLLLIWGQKSSDVDRKRAFFSEAKVLFAQVGDQDGQAWSKNYLAVTYFPDDLAESRRLFLEAKKDFASLSMPRANAVCTKQLGLVELQDGNFRQALIYYREAAQIFRDVGDEREAQALTQKIEEFLSKQEDSNVSI